MVNRYNVISEARLTLEVSNHTFLSGCSWLIKIEKKKESHFLQT